MRIRRLLAAGVLAAIPAMMTGPAAADPVPGYAGVKTPPGHPLDEAISGYWFRSDETRAMQDDDFANPGFLLVDRGEELWVQAEGAAGKSCADCHDAAEDSMKGVGARYPVFDAKLGKPINLELRINQCRTERMQAEPWKYESEPLLAMTTFVRNQSHGTPVQVQIDGPMQPFFEAGKKLYYERRGQLDMACASCHEANTGQMLRADHLSQGQSNGFPLYRLKWQGVGSLHRRLEGCMTDVRAEAHPKGSDELVNLELYLAYRGMGLPVETPAVRQ